jgi:predicted dehydrogenase
MKPPRVRIGLVGPGMIATVFYGVLPNLGPLADRMELVAVCGRRLDRATAVAEQFGIPEVYTDLATMLRGSDLDAVINLTPALAHYETSMMILESGRHLVTDKPLAGSLAEADDICRLAAERRLVVVTAPYDVLGHDLQSARQLVATGGIGRVAFARVQSSHAGAAAMGWPVDPAPYYQAGAGSLFDMGVYGIHRATGVLGSARRVMALSGITSATRRVKGGPFDGATIDVQEHDNTLLMLDFGDSIYASIDATFNVVGSRAPQMEIYGSTGTIVLNRPEISPSMEIYRLDAAPGIDGWVTPMSYGLPGPPDRSQQLMRAVLIDHLLDCLETGSEPLLSGAFARHVLEIMLSARRSAEEGVAVDLITSF